MASGPASAAPRLLAADALAEPPPERQPFDIPDDRGGGGTRNGDAALRYRRQADRRIT